jgi:hypothetical protein
MNNSVDLESPMMQVLQTADDLKLFGTTYYDGPNEMTLDEVYNHIEGIRAMFVLRWEHMYDQYLRKMELDQYCTDPDKLLAREELFNFKKKGSKK